MSKKVLIVDDSRVVIMMEQMLLTNAGYEVSVAHDGAEALVAARREHPDAILMDVMMPKMSGFDACAALRAQRDTQHIPVIFVTTQGEVPDVENGYTLGCNEYVTKPIDSAELLAKLRDVLGA